MALPDREALINKLTLDSADSALGDHSFLCSIFEDGFKGYKNMTDEELLQCHVDAFDRDWRDDS